MNENIGVFFVFYFLFWVGWFENNFDNRFDEGLVSVEPRSLRQTLPAHWARILDRFPAVDAAGVEEMTAWGGVASQDERLHAYSAHVP